MRGLQSHENMYVISHTAYGKRDASGCLHASTDKRVEPGTPLWNDNRRVVFRCEDDVVIEIEVGGWHRESGSSAPARAVLFISWSPVVGTTG